MVFFFPVGMVRYILDHSKEMVPMITNIFVDLSNARVSLTLLGGSRSPERFHKKKGDTNFYRYGTGTVRSTCRGNYRTVLKNIGVSKLKGEITYRTVIVVLCTSSSYS